MKPSPRDLPQTINPEAGPARVGVETHRNLNCHYYDQCLDEAARRGWQSFTCARCALYAQVARPLIGIDQYAQQRRAVL